MTDTAGVHTYTYDAANRLTHRDVSDGRTYTYDWSARGQLLAEYTQGYPVRTFTYDGAGQLVEATVFTQTTRFRYNGLGARIEVEVVGHGATTYALDYAGRKASGVSAPILAETSLTETVLYLYGHECLGEVRDAEPLYYLHDAEGYVRQGVDVQGDLTATWLFDPDGTMLEGPDGPVSHLVCGGVYDGSTGLIYKDGGYFDPRLGIWLMLAPLVVVQSWRRRKKRRQWVLLLCAGLFAVGGLAGCGKEQVGMVCIDENIPQSQWKLVPDYLRYDYERDYTSNLISAFGELHTDLSEVNWAGISSDKTIQNTDDLVDTVKGSTIEWADIPVYGRSDPDAKIIKMKSSLLFGPLELSLPVLSHEAHHIYLGSRKYYNDHNVDAERVAHAIQWFVWEQIRPCYQGEPEDDWFLVNYADREIPHALNEDEFKNYIIPELRSAYERHEGTWRIANRRLENAREIIKEWYDF